MIGRAVSHYRVLSTLGSGGMGVVYLAEDERLGRQVALKFLPAESVTNRQALDRFRVEARAASSLSHPGICAIFDIGEDAGTPFIVMEVLKGESLRDRINRGPLKVLDLLDIAIQLADALDAAHNQGIIHRDIKPSNIFVGDKNRTKILDFGLAKLTQSATPPSIPGETRALDASTHRELTMPGSALGTVSYMSPEQARGEEVDTRTDLFSLGVVLYEMATGIQAFGGTTQAIVFDAILNRTPQPITHINPLIPARLDALIATALEKERDLRQQHASDFEAELKRIRRDLESGSIVASSVSRTVIVPAADRRSVSTAAATAPPPTSRRWIWVAASALVVLVLAITGFMLWSNNTSGVDQVAVANPPPAGPSATPQTATPTNTTQVPAPVVTPEPPPPAPTRAQETIAPGRPAPQSQPQQPARPTAEPRPPTSQPGVTPTPQRPPADAPRPGAVTLPAPSPSAAVSPPQTTEAPPAPTPTPTPAPSLPTPQPAAEPPAAQPPPRNAATTPTAPAIPPSSPVESDDSLIRGVLRTYERAYETKSVDLFRSVRPGLSAAEESRLRTSFSQVDSQQVDIAVEEIRIEGRAATVRLSRRDTITSGGRRQTAASRQTLRLEKTAGAWIITEIIGR